MPTVVDATNPGTRVRSNTDNTIIAQVVCNADGSSIGNGLGTYVTAHVANSGSTTIPTTAKRWAVNFIGTGTANTLGTNTSISGGQGFSDNASPSTALTVSCDGSTVADIIYSTT